MDRLLINCDLGENETDEQTEKLLGLVDAANICCGVHAGCPAKTKKTLQIAAEHEILVGAHPGLANAGGRGTDLPLPSEFRDLLEEQIIDFKALAGEEGVGVDYVKLHGSLYHAVEEDEAYANTYLELLLSLAFKPGVFARAGGSFARKAKNAGVKVWSEGFADRCYLKNGSLVLRSERGAVLAAGPALSRFEKWRGSGRMDTIDGEQIALEADTFCVHSDSPDVDVLLRRIRDLIG